MSPAAFLLVLFALAAAECTSPCGGKCGGGGGPGHSQYYCSWPGFGCCCGYGGAGRGFGQGGYGQGGYGQVGYGQGCYGQGCYGQGGYGQCCRQRQGCRERQNFACCCPTVCHTVVPHVGYIIGQMGCEPPRPPPVSRSCPKCCIRPVSITTCCH